MSPIESALVLLVPEAEALVTLFRDLYDPSAAAGMPAHITLLYPFKPPNEVSDAVIDNLRHRFARSAPFPFSLIAVRRFGMEALYLAVEPEQQFRSLTSAIWDLHPESPPYRGKWRDIVPHLTVAHLADKQHLRPAADEFAQICQQRLPIQATATEVALMDNDSGRWQTRSTFGLGT